MENIPTNSRYSGFQRDRVHSHRRDTCFVRPQGKTQSGLTMPGYQFRNWKCNSCGLQVTTESIVRGEAQLADGQMTCSQCCLRRSNASKRRLRRLFVAGILVLVACFAAMIVPKHLVFIVLLFSLVLGTCGIFGSEFSRKWRISMVLGAIILGGVCHTLLSVLAVTSDERFNEAQLDAVASRVLDLIDRGRLLDAIHLQATLNDKTRLANTPDQDAHTAMLAKKIQQSFEGRLESEYGLLSSEERLVLFELFDEFLEFNKDSTRFFNHIGMRSDSLSLGVALDADHCGSSAIQAIRNNARVIALFLFKNHSEIENIELEFSASVEQQHQGTIVQHRTIVLSRDLFLDLNSGHLDEIIPEGY